ncbi:hypothetical protein ACFXTO_009226 [Malus domestica]
MHVQTSQTTLPWISKVQASTPKIMTVKITNPTATVSSFFVSASMALLSLLCRVLTPRWLKLLSPTPIKTLSLLSYGMIRQVERLGGKLFLQSLNNRVSELKSRFDRPAKENSQKGGAPPVFGSDLEVGFGFWLL